MYKALTEMQSMILQGVWAPIKLLKIATCYEMNMVISVVQNCHTKDRLWEVYCSLVAYTSVTNLEGVKSHPCACMF